MKDLAKGGLFYGRVIVLIRFFDLGAGDGNPVYLRGVLHPDSRRHRMEPGGDGGHFFGIDA